MPKTVVFVTAIIEENTLLVGYARVSKTDRSQSTDLQRDALVAAGVAPDRIYEDRQSGAKDDRPGLRLCLEVLRPNDTLVVWKLDRLGRNLNHLVSTVDGLAKNGIGLRVISGAGGGMETTSAQGRLVFGIFASLAEFERELIRERTTAGLAAARSRGRCGGRPPKITPDAIRIIQGAMQSRATSVTVLCKQFEITKTTLYRLVSPSGELRNAGKSLLVNPIKKPFAM